MLTRNLLFNHQPSSPRPPNPFIFGENKNKIFLSPADSPILTLQDYFNLYLISISIRNGREKRSFSFNIYEKNRGVGGGSINLSQKFHKNLYFFYTDIVLSYKVFITYISIVFIKMNNEILIAILKLLLKLPSFSSILVLIRNIIDRRSVIATIIKRYIQHLSL